MQRPLRAAERGVALALMCLWNLYGAQLPRRTRGSAASALFSASQKKNISKLRTTHNCSWTLAVVQLMHLTTASAWLPWLPTDLDQSLAC
eukprot:366301-Chlamydomonas_euryale.AAC.25